MIPNRTLLNAIGPAIAAHAATLAPAEDENQLALITNDFTPGNDLALGSLTLASLAGLTPIALVAGAQLESLDPLTGDVLVEIKAPAGGFRWEATAGSGYPVDIKGVALLDNAGTTLLGTEAITPAIQIGGANQSYTHPKLVMRIPRASIR